MTNPEWTTAAMAEPWHRDLVGQMVAEHEHLDDVGAWSLRIANVYGKSGTLEVTACILALRAELLSIWTDLDTSLDGDDDRQMIAERAWTRLGALLGTLEG